MAKVNKIEQVGIDKLIPYINNAKQHTESQVTKIASSIREFGFVNPVLIDKDYNIIAGHGRVEAAKKLGLDNVPCVYIEGLSDTQRKAYILADNRLGELAEWDMDLVTSELEALQEQDFNIDLTGFELPEEYGGEKVEHGKLTDKFIVPPFSVLDTRRGYWQDRKATWKKYIGDKGQGRDEAAVIENHFEEYGYGGAFEKMSILDPVLCEVMLKWFAPDDCRCFDVFAGDTSFGFVSSYLGHKFTGIELRQEQVDFNREHTAAVGATYICDDGRNVLKHIKKESQDFLFSCPPYFDLEVYSDLENDASNQKTYTEFYKIIDQAFTDAVQCLKDNRFAVIVCGDVRDKKSKGYYCFPDDIKRTFIKNGLVLYNEFILVDPIGTATVRANKSMETRKAVKVHQNVLVFYKGDATQIKNVFPVLEAINASEDMEF